MSRSKPNRAENPAVRFFEWKAQKGVLQYYDKANKENVEVPIPFKFLVLDQLHTVKGGTKVQGSYVGFYSNEVRDIKRETITLRSKNGIEAEGTYQEVKAHRGAKYTKSIYIAFDNGGELEIGNIQAIGSANSAWIEFSNSGVNLNTCAVTIKDRKKIEGEQSDYYEPVFEASECPQKLNELAWKLDGKLQEYLSDYFGRGARENDEYAQGEVSANRFPDDPDLVPSDEEEAAGRGWNEQDGTPVENDTDKQPAIGW